MAITKEFTTIHGIELPSAYIRVESVRLVTKSEISFSVCIYADQSKPMVECISAECAYDINGENPIAQAYSHIKTMHEFFDAVDC